MFGIIGAIVALIGDVTKGGLNLGAAKKTASASKSVADKRVEEAKIAAEAQLKAANETVKQEILKSLAVHVKEQKSTDKTGEYVLIIVLFLITAGLGFAMFGGKKEAK